MKKYLLIDIGSTYTKLCIVDTKNRSIIAAAASPTTIGTDVRFGVDNAKKQIHHACSSIDSTLICSSAAGGLKIVVIGLVPELTLKAAQLAALSAGGKIIAQYSYFLTKEHAEALRLLEPDIVLIAGGTDGGNASYICHNTELIVQSVPEVPILFAGNQAAYPKIRELVSYREHVYFTKNIMPTLDVLDIEPTQTLIREIFLKRIVSAKGLDKLCQDSSIVCMPTPLAVFRACILLSNGYNGESGWGELLCIDIGGATTDIHSVCKQSPCTAAVILKGIMEPDNKRTVEADIGLAYSLDSLLQNVIRSNTSMADGERVFLDRVKQWVSQTKASHPHHIAVSPDEQDIENFLAVAGSRISLQRHCGYIEELYSMQGKITLQYGKDFTSIPRIIGSGTIMKDPERAGVILSHALQGIPKNHLVPQNPVIMHDKHYIMWAMGLLSSCEPESALWIMKHNIHDVSTRVLKNNC